MKKNSDPFKEKGFSLVELVLVVMIVGFIVMLVTNLPSSLALIGKSKSTSLAKDIASQEIENERALTYDNLANSTTSFYDSRLSSLTNSLGTLTISDCPSQICTSGEQIKQVVVTVSWTEGTTPRNVTLTTLVSKGGLP